MYISHFYEFYTCIYYLIFVKRSAHDVVLLKKQDLQDKLVFLVGRSDFNEYFFRERKTCLQRI